MAKIKNRKPKSKLMMYFFCHLHAACASFGQIIRAPFANLMTILVIAIALAMPTTLYVMLQNVRSLGQGWNKNSTQIALYLQSDLSQTHVQDFLHQLRSDADVSNVKYISPKQGLVSFGRIIGSNQVTKLLSHNPLPGVAIVQPILSLRHPAQLQRLYNQLQALPEVAIAQLDMQWIQRLNSIIDLADSVVFVLALLLGIGVLLIIGNTIRLSTQNQRREINVFKMVGATNTFIRRPFLYSGIWYGILAGIIAWFIVAGILSWLQQPVAALASSYDTQFNIEGLSANFGILLIIISALLGFLGSWVVVNRSLKSQP